MAKKRGGRSLGGRLGPAQLPTTEEYAEGIAKIAQKITGTNGLGQPVEFEGTFVSGEAPRTLAPEVLESIRKNQDLSKGGVKFDTGKFRMSLLDPNWLAEIAQLQTNEPDLRLDLLTTSTLKALGRILQHGADKYCERNWEVGMTWSRAYDALFRHMLAWAAADTLDKDTRYNHLWHAVTNLVFLIEWETTHPELDDRPFGPVKGKKKNGETKQQ